MLYSFVSDAYDFQRGSKCTPLNIGIVEYEWSWTNGQLETLTTAATAFYRFVTPEGQLLSITPENTVSGGQSIFGESATSADANGHRDRNGMGAGVATIDSQHLLITDNMGGVYIAKTDDYYTGDFVYSFSGNPNQTYTFVPAGDWWWGLAIFIP